MILVSQDNSMMYTSGKLKETEYSNLVYDAHESICKHLTHNKRLSLVAELCQNRKSIASIN